MYSRGHLPNVFTKRVALHSTLMVLLDGALRAQVGDADGPRLAPYDTSWSSTSCSCSFGSASPTNTSQPFTHLKSTAGYKLKYNGAPA